MQASELFDLSGKVAIITGGAGSIGTAYGRALGEAGASVVLADVDEDAATTAAAALQADGFDAIGVAVDVSDLASAQAMARAAVDAFGGIDILVNNAAIMRDLPQYGLSNMPVDEWDRVLDVNLRGPLLCTQAVLPSMIERGGGRIINGLSAGAFSAGGIYGISKYALHCAHREPRDRARPAGHQRERDRTRARRGRERLREPRRGLADPVGARSGDPGQEVRSTGGSGGHAPAALLEGRRLDQRPDDQRRRRLGHAALTLTTSTVRVTTTGRDDLVRLIDTRV